MAFRNKVSIFGFMVGSIADIVGTNLWAVVVTLYILFNYNLLLTTALSTEITEKVLSIFKTDPLIFSLNFIAGSFFSILGGYIGAFIAKHDELLNGALSSFLCVLSGLYAIFNGSYSVPLYLAILSLFFSPVLSMFGGYLRLKQKSKKQSLVPA